MARANLFMGPGMVDTVEETLVLFAKDLVTAIHLFLGSQDIQVNPIPVMGGVLQFVEVKDGNMQRFEDSGIAVEIICVEQDVDEAHLEKLARVCVALIIAHYGDKGLTNPNTWVRVYGTHKTGWSEGLLLAGVATSVKLVIDGIIGKARQYSLDDLDAIFA